MDYPKFKLLTINRGIQVLKRTQEFNNLNNSNLHSNSLAKLAFTRYLNMRLEKEQQGSTAAYYLQKLIKEYTA